jgi:signal transduction histidine kinase
MAEPVDPRWPKLLSLTVHEFRTPMTVVAGYIRMLLKDRAGPLSDQQRRLLAEAEKSCARLSALLADVSELSHLEADTIESPRQPLDLRQLLRGAIEGLPELPDRTVRADLETSDSGPAPIRADPQRLQSALASVIAALRREIVTSDRIIVRERAAQLDGQAVREILIGDEPTIAALEAAGGQGLPVFDEWRGGSGLSLAIARRIIGAHGGSIWSAPEGHKTGARIVIPAG